MSWRRQTPISFRQSVMLAQNFSLCGKLFGKKIGLRDSNRGSIVLSSIEFITATRLVQEVLAKRGLHALEEEHVVDIPYRRRRAPAPPA